MIDDAQWLDPESGTVLGCSSQVTSGQLDPDSRTRLLGESRGNPLALVEVARELTPEQLTGDAVLPDPLPATGSPRQLFARRLRQLTPEAQLLLAVAALRLSGLFRIARRWGRGDWVHLRRGWPSTRAGGGSASYEARQPACWPAGIE